MTVLVPKVEIAWSGDLIGVFTLDDGTGAYASDLDGDDTLAAAFGNDTFDDISGAVNAFTIRRGRSGNLGMVQAGSCTLTLNDLNGTYNPRNPASPLAGLLDAMRPVRVSIERDGTTYGLFYGFISDITSNPSIRVQEATIECVDLYDWLNNCKPTIAATGATTVGAVIGLILDELGWLPRDLDTGGSIPDFSADGTKSAWTLIEELLKVDLGLFYPSGDSEGTAIYRSRDSRWCRSAPLAVWDGLIMSGLRPSLNARSIVNRQTVTRTGGTAQTYTDEDSRRAKGYRDGSAIESAYLSTDGEALNLAEFLVALQVSGRPPVENVVLIGVDEDWEVQILNRQLNDRVTLSETRGGTSLDGVIEGVTLNWTVVTPLTASYTVSHRPFDVFTLADDVADDGGSDIGGDDILGY